MHEQDKIYEAHYFLIRADACGENRHEFGYNLSAFLTAARSVLQYALEEAKAKPGGQAWYDASVSAIPEVKFLKDKRDISVHERPVLPSRRINVGLSDGLSLSDSVHVTVTRTDGTIERDPEPQPTLPTATHRPEASESTVTYFFPDWPGTEDVMEICITYINAIEQIVKSGRALGHVT